MARDKKAILCFFSVIVIGFIVFSMYSTGPANSSKALHSIVSQTHQKLYNLQKLKDELQGRLPLDNELLSLMGFNDQAILYPKHTWSNISSPAFVSAVSSTSLVLLEDLIETFNIIDSDKSIIIYTLDLSTYELEQAEAACNQSCHIVIFNFSLYPSHIKNLGLSAFRPIIIQEVLTRAGSVFWLDPCIRPLNKNIADLATWQAKALQNGGLLTWRLVNPHELPTTALTHPDMFAALDVDRREYDFQKMSDPKSVIIVNTKKIHLGLMKPWVTCALMSNCLNPIGAQGTGCKFNKKPKFRFSGCHLYDTSAFNVALGLAFGVDSTVYLDTRLTFVCISNTADRTSNLVNKEVSGDFAQKV